MADKTPIYICGAECGLTAIGTASAGVEHLTQFGGSTSVVTSGPVPMRSKRAWYFNGTSVPGSLNATVFATAIASPATAVARIYVYFNSLPSVDCDLIVFTSGTTLTVGFKQSDSTIRAHTATGGVVVTTGQWYCIDAKAVFNTTRTVDVKVNGVAATQYSAAGSAATCTGIQWGAGVGASGTFSHYMDDLVVSGTSGDYPFGEGTVAGLYPMADGTHVTNSTGDFGKGSAAGTGVNQSDTDCWQSLANPLSTTIGTNYLGAIGATSTEYLEFVLENLPMSRFGAAAGWHTSTGSHVHGLMLVVATHSASTTTNNLTARLRDPLWDSTADLIALDLSETTITVPSVVRYLDLALGGRLVDASGGSVGIAGINDLLFRFVSSDVAPDVYLDGFCLEVSYEWNNAEIRSVRQAVRRGSLR